MLSPTDPVFAAAIVGREEILYRVRHLLNVESGLNDALVVKDLAPYYRIIGFDRPGMPEPPPQAESVSVDLTKPESLCHGLEHVCSAYGAQIASVIHLAAY